MTQPFTPAELNAIQAAAEAATPGPWRWELNEKSKRVALQGGKPKYDCTVMDFVRYGMNGAMPRFVTEPKPFMNIMKPCTAYAKEVEGREHHADWFKTIDNQDANFIATLDPATVLRLVEQIKRLTKQVDEAKEVISPFALVAEGYREFGSDSVVNHVGPLNAGDLHRAAQFLAPEAK